MFLSGKYFIASCATAALWRRSSISEPRAVGRVEMTSDSGQWRCSGLTKKSVMPFVNPVNQVEWRIAFSLTEAS
jgi:hypothetical protein